MISKTDLEIADGLILKFCKPVETLYGKHVIMPNMHLHNHLKEVILDHGPVTSFWCFSFERFNEILGSTTTNKRFVQLQLMRQFLISRQLKDMDLPEQYQDDFLHLCSPTGMVNADVKEDVSSLSWSVKHEFNNVGINWRNDSGVTVPSNYKLVHFDEDDAALLRDVYQIMYPESEIEMGSLVESIRKFGLLNICSTTSGSKMQPEGIRSGKILASWPTDNGKDVL